MIIIFLSIFLLRYFIKQETKNMEKWKIRILFNYFKFVARGRSIQIPDYNKNILRGKSDFFKSVYLF